ncbi:MAG TPA: cytochrome P450 [Candidatus Limnocylindria bacterium]|nr:cytochrome P450 [Candidatus Limnocylindria bacterium]
MNVLERDFFTDPEILADPIPYYRALHERGPVFREPHQGVFMLSRIDDVEEIYRDHARFSAIVGPLGPFVSVPKPAPGERWAEAIERGRHEVPMGDTLPSLDPPKHTRHRTLAGRLFTPNRLKQNEEFILTLADRLIDEFAERGEAEFSADYAKPFTLLVIADLLGVPHEDHETFRGWLGGQRGNVGDPKGRHVADQVFANLAPYFTRYIEERRAEPRDDFMSRLATVRFADGELPAVEDVVRLASIIFAAGQETTARLLLAAMRILCEQPAVADALRQDPGMIPNFVEECLRLEGPIKGSFRLALEDTTISGVAVPAGSIAMAVIGAANRDPRVFADPDRFDVRRPNARRNVAFGYGEHFCIGASLARTEVRISFERLLARLDRLELADPSALSYLGSFIIRGLNDLPIRFRRRA